MNTEVNYKIIDRVRVIRRGITFSTIRCQKHGDVTRELAMEMLREGLISYYTSDDRAVRASATDFTGRNHGSPETILIYTVTDAGRDYAQRHAATYNQYINQLAEDD